MIKGITCFGLYNTRAKLNLRVILALVFILLTFSKFLITIVPPNFLLNDSLLFQIRGLIITSRALLSIII